MYVTSDHQDPAVDVGPRAEMKVGLKQPWLGAGLLVACSVAYSIGLRIFCRGDGLPGMGLLLASHGKRLWADLGWRAVPLTIYQVRHFWLPSNAWTLLYGLVPGWLAYY